MKKRTRNRKKHERVVLGNSVRDLMRDMCERRGMLYRPCCIEAGLGRNFAYGSGGMSLDTVRRFFKLIPPTEEESVRFLDLLVPDETAE